MKKAIISATAILFTIMFIFQTSLVAFAEETPDWQDAVFTQEEIDNILSLNPDNQIDTRATGLIVSCRIAISGSGANLYIIGKTFCDPDVIKCGFTVVTIKRRPNSGASWATYKTYKDLYDSGSSYSLSKTLSVSTGYQYRVYCTHYAKKNIFSTQKFENASNVIYLG